MSGGAEGPKHPLNGGAQGTSLFHVVTYTGCYYQQLIRL